LTGALGVGAGMLLSHRATAEPPLALPPHATHVICPSSMTAKAVGWTLATGPWKPTVVAPATPPPSASGSGPSSATVSPGPTHGPFPRAPEGGYELPGTAVTPTSTFRLSGVYVEPFQRMLRCEYAATSDTAPYASFAVTQPYPAGQECNTTAQALNVRSFVCQ